MSDSTRKKLTENQKRWLIKRLTQRMPHKKIKADFIAKFGRDVSSVTLTRLTQKHSSAIIAAQSAIVEVGAVQAVALKQKSYALLERRMDAAVEDETEVMALRRKLRDGEISKTDYELAVRSYTQLSVSDLTSIANMAHNHTKNDDTPNTPQDKAAMEMLLEGIRSGNAVQLVQVFNPTRTHGT